MTKQELLELIIAAKELGLKSLEVDGVKVEFNTNESVKNRYLEGEQETLEAKDLVAPISKYDELTDEEILYWSSDYGKELQERRLKEQQENAQRKAEDLARESL